MKAEAYEHVVTNQQQRVHAYARLVLRDAAEAQDVTQEALIRLWQHRHQVQAAGARPWLMRTAHNLCIDRLRKSKVRSEVDDGGAVLDLEADFSPGPQQLAESSELGDTIRDALAELSPEDRSVLVLREVQGHSYDEIAGALKLPLGTLKARLHRARERLRARLNRAGVQTWMKQATGS